MRKFLSILICGILLIGLTGCGNDEKKKNVHVPENINKLENKNEETQNKTDNEINIEDIFFKVIDGNKNYYNEENKEVAFADYLKTYLENSDVTLKYSLINMDNLNYDEMILTLDDQQTNLIFHYENDNVYGYEVNFRYLKNIKTDGSYATSDSAFHSTIETSKFNKNERTNNIIAEYNYGKSITINGNNATEKEYNDYYDEWNEKENVKFKIYKKYEKKINKDKLLSVGSHTLKYGTYYLKLTDGTLATDNSGTIILNKNGSCAYYEGWADMECSSYYVKDKSICLKTRSSEFCFIVPKNNQIENKTGNIFVFSK